MPLKKLITLVAEIEHSCHAQHIEKVIDKSDVNCRIIILDKQGFKQVHEFSYNIENYTHERHETLYNNISCLAQSCGIETSIIDECK